MYSAVKFALRYAVQYEIRPYAAAWLLLNA
jgi:hypothetical protein